MKNTECRLLLLLTVYLLPTMLQGIPQLDMWGLVGETVYLPCKVDTETCGVMHSIKWYRGSSRIYVFSELSSISRPEGDYTPRAKLIYETNGTESKLEVKSLQVADEAVYKCEITYIEVREGCAVVQFINLTALIKPEYVKVSYGDGTDLQNATSIGPFNEGDELSLECESGGGKPTPSVSWWNGTHKMTGEYTTESGANSVGTGRNRVKMTLGRGDLGTRYACQASNQALAHPMVAWIDVDVNVRPLDVVLEGVESHAVQGSFVMLHCVVTGARPAANVTWYNGTVAYPESEDQGEDGVNLQTTYNKTDKTFTTSSWLRFKASLYENQRTLRCEAINAVMQAKGEKPIRKSKTLEVRYPPIVTISSRAGDNVTVNETTDISIFCSYEANPMTLKSVRWYVNGNLLQLIPDHHEEGTTDNPDLLIRNSTSYDQGAYTCELENEVGVSESGNAVYVSVYFKPVVFLTMDPSTPVKEVDNLNITLMCNVKSGNPDLLTAVRWYLDGEMLKELPECGGNSSAADNALFCDIDPSKLLLEVVGRSFHGNYSCEGMNEAGWGPLSPDKELIVHYPPGPATLVYEPSRVVKRHTVTLSCSVDDPGRPETTTFRWMRGSHDIHDVTTANLTIDPVTLETQSNFSCLARNDGGEGEPATVYIAVHAPPAFIERLPPYHGALLNAQHINVSCRVECSPLCSVHWLKNDDLLQPGNGSNSRYTVLNVELPPDTSTNDFQSIRSTLLWNMSAWPGGQLDRNNDNAKYTCQSTSNEVGAGVKSSTTFGVEYPPENITVSNKVVYVTENNVPEKVLCSAKAYPEATYHWRREGGKQDSVVKGSSLTLNFPLERQKSGNYICVATNKHGNITQKTTINVLYKPECGITQTEMDGKLVLTCTANANPTDVDFTWRIKGENDTIEENIEKKGQQSQLTLESYVENFRTYLCFANNSVGMSIPCERDVTGHVISWWKKFENDNLIIIIAVIVGAILMMIIVCITIIVVCRRKRADDKCPSPSATKDKSKQDLASSPSDGLLQPDGDKAFYENLPFHGMQSAPNKPAAPSHAPHTASRPSSQLSQNGSSGYGSTRSHAGPQSVALLPKSKFSSLRVHATRHRARLGQHFPHFYSMRLHKKDRERSPEHRIFELHQMPIKENSPEAKQSPNRENPPKVNEPNNNSDNQRVERLQPPVPAPRKQAPNRATKHTYQNVPIPITPNSQELTIPKSQLQQQHHHHYNLTSQHHLLMNPTTNPNNQCGSSRRSHSNRTYLPPMRLEYQQPYYVTDSVVYADLALRDPHIPPHYRPQQTPTEYAILKFHDVGQEIDV